MVSTITVSISDHLRTSDLSAQWPMWACVLCVPTWYYFKIKYDTILLNKQISLSVKEFSEKQIQSQVNPLYTVKLVRRSHPREMTTISFLWGVVFQCWPKPIEKWLIFWSGITLWSFITSGSSSEVVTKASFTVSRIVY